MRTTLKTAVKMNKKCVQICKKTNDSVLYHNRDFLIKKIRLNSQKDKHFYSRFLSKLYEFIHISERFFETQKVISKN